MPTNKKWSTMYVTRSNGTTNTCWISTSRDKLAYFQGRSEISYHWFTKQGITLRRGCAYKIRYMAEVVEEKETRRLDAVR